MEDMDKAIEIMKAAMEKEKEMNEKSNESMDHLIDEETKAAELAKELCEDAATEEDEVINENLDENSDENLDENLDEIADETKETSNKSAEGKAEKGSKSFFKNAKSKDLAVKDQKIEELSDRVMRTMAEFDNFRKRSEKEKSAMYDIGVKSIIEKLLPVVDNFERGLGTLTDKEKESGFAQGIDMIYRQLMTTLDEIGLKPIDAVGKEFDPNLHNAVMHGEDDSLGENIVSDEFQKGYIYRDMVVRHSMVKVVN